MNERAFTLMEMSIVLIIVGVVASIAYPGMMKLLRLMESKKVESIIHNALIFARSESYIRRKNLLVCPADEFNVCHKQASQKVIVFVDMNENHRFDEGELIQEYYLGLKHGRLDMRVSLGRNYVKYFGNTGTPRGHFGHIKYCSTGGERLSYKVVISHQGRIRKEEEGC